ncbi:MAG: SDR family oxidoreductase [Acidobacteriaceae bacterium]|nr:SDR family oxidoreductase [Acidobacteriaceae bacterium]
MQMTGNTILITGGGSGIGRGLAEAFHALGNRVVIAGRRQQALDEVTAANAGMEALTLDIEDAAAIRSFADQVTKQYPSLNVVINNAGIMRPENLTALPPDLSDSEAIIRTNLLGPIRLISALLRLLRKQPHATVMMVSSGLAFVPMAPTATYCATKAAIHSYTQSLRQQLKDTNTEVLELIPPYVGTELMPGGTTNPHAMPLDQFIAEVMDILKREPHASEICVERVKPLRFAEATGKHAEMFQMLNRLLE